MLDFLSDPNWLEVIIGAIALIISTALAVYFYLRTRQVKKLAYEIIASEPLLTINEAHVGDVKILFKGEEVTDAHIVVIKLINNGNIPITEDDMNWPPAFAFGKETKILSYEITDKDPSTLPASLRLSRRERGIVLNKLLLNASDYITMKFLLTNYKSELQVTGRIIGVKEITKFSHSITSRIIKSSGFFLLIGVIASIIANFLASGSSIINPNVLAISQTFLIIALAMIILGFIIGVSIIRPTLNDESYR